MAPVDPNSIFAILNGKVQARFTFCDMARSVLDSVGIYDVLGRPCFDIDLRNNRHYINLYLSPSGNPAYSPRVTLCCTDGSGIPHQKKDWQTGEFLCAEQPLTWRACEATSQPADSNE
jgi:hypothetical protein